MYVSFLFLSNYIELALAHYLPYILYVLYVSCGVEVISATLEKLCPFNFYLLLRSIFSGKKEGGGCGHIVRYLKIDDVVLVSVAL